jgi:hypothetical protein
MFICRRHAQCQSLTVLEQLRAGIRCLDVRLRLGSDGVIRASHSNRLSSLELEFLFMSMEDIVHEIVRFFDDNRSEVVFLKIRMDFRAPDLGGGWKQVYKMLEPLLSKLLPFSQRMQTIGQITGGGKQLCIACRQLREVYGDVFWPWEFFAGSWDVTGSCRWRDLHERLRTYVAAHPIINDGSCIQYLQGEITQRISTAVKGSLRSDAQLANAVLLDLLQDNWIGIPLQIVTQDFCNDTVIEALINRNLLSSPFDALSPSRGAIVRSPDELRSSEVLTSNDGRYFAIFNESGSLNIFSRDNVLCYSMSFASASSQSPGDFSLRLSIPNALVCACHGEVVWAAKPGFTMPYISSFMSKLSPVLCCGASHAPFTQLLVLTDSGELHVERHHDDGQFSVEWSSDNRLLKSSRKF